MDQVAGVEHVVGQDGYDVVVVGGGSAGLSGALALGRARRRVLVVDAGDPRNAPAAGVHNYLTSEGLPPAELVAAGRAEVEAYGVEVRRGTAVAAAPLDVGPGRTAFTVDLADGTRVRARRLLVTTGLTDLLPDVPGVAQRWGRDVVHCPYCHGYEVRDEPVGVLGTGPMAAHVALLFRQWSPDVVLFQHTAPALTPEEAEQLAARGIDVVAEPVAGLEVVDDRLSGVRLVSGAVVPRRAVVVSPRFAARSAVLEGLGVAAEEFRMGEHVLGTSVPADPMGATSVPGVRVAGNVTAPMAQVIAAAAAGLQAGAALNGELVTEDTALAVARHREEAGAYAGRS
ncbi:NAD(P)/FAD-dependent oxidoreductase [Microlunatus capsulatus]|uniref:Thioredoxin reductase n=1 Tax=Microlunatus capsulatus TaxID=99117 RepID=A0ABS4ZA40_9ACTN|nr:NAD(P)/FAD-dependent oxidoreductase [Microlunatus capsulatus]MBP2417824.1 thioredoxin reductase [Microlunatus capsulatus]